MTKVINVDEMVDIIHMELDREDVARDFIERLEAIANEAADFICLHRNLDHSVALHESFDLGGTAVCFYRTEQTGTVEEEMLKDYDVGEHLEFRTHEIG